MDAQRWLKTGLLAGAVLLIGIGAALAASGVTAGWVIVAVGVIDMLTVPLVLRATGRRSGSADSRREAAEPPATDRAHNPYARED